MPKKAISLTLAEANLLWLKGRARVLAGGSLSGAVDQLIDEARAGRLGAVAPVRSVVGTIDVPDEATLESGGEAIRSLFARSHAGLVQEPQRAPRATKQSRKKTRG
jgi:hypothetical protein